MQIPFGKPGQKWLLVAVAAVFALVYLSIAGRECYASLLGERVDLAALQEATRLDPGNAEYRDRLGRYYDLISHDPAAAIGPYRAAVQLNPHSARFWFDLAGAYQVLGDISAQKAALEHAIEADPTTPDVAWEAANLYLVRGENEKALREFRVVLSTDLSLIPSAISFCWRIKPDADVLLRDVVPPHLDANVAFLSLLMTKGETAATAKVWAAIMQIHEPIELRYVLEYFHYLVLHKDVDQATLVWQQAAGRLGYAAYLPSPHNLIVNGNFSLDVLNGGLDWQYEKQQSVELTLDPSDFHGGRRSLLVTFDGPRVTDAGIFQYVPVQPNTTYEFTGYYKTGEFDGAGGPHFTVQDMYTQTVYYESDELKDAGFWKSATGEFTTGPDCRLVVLHIRRLPEGSPIRGKLWVGDFHLSRKS
jgi:tetratricopeptide (TPR) repeat protein